MKSKNNHPQMKKIGADGNQKGDGFLSLLS
jgi:hypothetical protein